MDSSSSSQTSASTFDPLKFLIPELHARNQNPEDEEAQRLWEENSQQYRDYFNSIKWPAGVMDLVENGCLHDATVLDIWVQNGCCVLTLKQDDGAWDGRDYIAVVSYKLVADPVVPKKVEDWQAQWLYNQFADLGEGKYREHIMLTEGVIVSDFTEVETTRVFLTGEDT